jgi:hypothetical protein
MHRDIDIEVPYRTLLKNLKRLGIHDPKPASNDTGDHVDESTGDEAAKRDGSGDEAGDKTPDSSSDSDGGSDPSSPEPPSSEMENGTNPSASAPREDLLDTLGVSDSEAVEEFGDMSTPGWLHEGTFYAAVETAEDIPELTEVMGWDEPELLDLMIELLDLEDGVTRVATDGGTKYGDLIPDSHWDDTDEGEPVDTSDNTSKADVESQTVELLWDADPEIRYRVHIIHGDVRWAPVASHASRAHRLAESRQFDPMGRVDWADLPVPVQERVSDIVAGVDDREQLDPEVRLVTTDD